MCEQEIYWAESNDGGIYVVLHMKYVDPIEIK